MIGSRIGHFRVTRVLGQGGMGDVYEAIEERLGRPVAIKAMRAERRVDTAARSRFLREARILSALDHPGICRILEYIETPDADFLVLELIDGITLQAAAGRGMSRARKVRIAAAIVDALAAAHRKGIVHRDLKPQNVMLAADGTVKVLDFGIARTRDAGDAPRTFGDDVLPLEEAETLIFRVDASPLDVDASPLGDDSPGETGLAVGTPQYMSPEQARGLAVTPASDLYSFGLLLQMLLTGKAPHLPELRADALLERVRVGETLPMTGQPRDLTALVTRLKSIAPADRPTAVETAAILRRILDKPKRRARMAIAVLAVLALIALAAKYVADVTAARRAAELRRHQAEEMVSFLVGDLRTQLEAAGRLDALDGAASRALSYFASLRPEELSGTNLHHASLALAQLGEVRINQGRLDEAERLFREAIRFAETAAGREPKREEWQLALSNATFWLGDAERRHGHHDAALREFRRYLDISERLAAAHPRQSKYQAEVSYGHGNVGAAYEAAGDLDRALSEYRVAVALDRQRLTREPRNEQWQSDLAISLNRLGVTVQTKGNSADARAVFEEELQLRRGLVAASPDDARRMGRLAVSLGYLGMLDQAAGANARALAAYEEELAIASKLADRDPANVSLRRNRAIAESRTAVLTSDLPRALRLAQHATAELREVVRAEARPTWRRDLASARLREATLLLATRDVRGAQAAAAEATRIGEDVARMDPRNPLTARLLEEARIVTARSHPPPH